MKNKINKVIGTVCSLIMVATVTLTLLAVPASAGNILIGGEERDPILTDRQIEKLLEENAAYRSDAARVEMDAIIAANNAKKQELEYLQARQKELKELLAERSEEYNAYDDLWNDAYRAVRDDPRYLEAVAQGDDEKVEEVLLDLTGWTREELEENRANVRLHDAELEAISMEIHENNVRIAVIQPCYAPGC